MKAFAAIAAVLALTPAAALAHAYGQDAHAGHEAHASADATVVAAHEAALRGAIEAVQTNTIDYSNLSPQLADAVRAQEGTVVPMIQGLGAVQTVDHRGEIDGAQHFRVTFENAATDWFITLDGETISGLVFRPAQ